MNGSVQELIQRVNILKNVQLYENQEYVLHTVAVITVHSISRVVVLRVSSTGTCQTLEKWLELLAKWSNGME